MTDPVEARLARSRCLYPPDAVDAAVDAVAGAIHADLAEAQPLLLCVMTGGLRFTSELLGRLQFPLELDYLHVSRYRSGTAGSHLEWRAFPTTPLRGRHLLLCDDILDEGVTLAALRDYCERQGAASVRAAVLVRKRLGHDRVRDRADYVGVEVPDEFVVGEGMDIGGLARNLRGIHAVGA